MSTEIVSPDDPRLGLHWPDDAVGFEQLMDGPLLLVVGSSADENAMERLRARFGDLVQG